MGSGAVGTSRGHSGVTLIELMVTIAVLAVIVTLAVPSFAGIINSNRLATAANELGTSLQLARMEAIRRNAPVSTCASTDAEAGEAASCDADTWGQWITFVDANGNRARENGEAVLRVSVLRDNLEVNADEAVGGAIMFAPDGLAYADGGGLLNGSVNVCLPTRTPAENNRNVSVAFGSTITIETGVPNEDCSK